jgi:hypothetical protein
MYPIEYGDGSWRVEPIKVDPNTFEKSGRRHQRLASDIDQQIITFLQKRGVVMVAIIFAMILGGLFRQEIATPIAYVMEGIRAQ